MKVQDILTDETKWCQHAWHDGLGKRCLNSAIFKATEFDHKKAGQIRDLVRAKINDGIIPWNDHPQRTFAEVRALIVELNI